MELCLACYTVVSYYSCVPVQFDRVHVDMHVFGHSEWAKNG